MTSRAAPLQRDPAEREHNTLEHFVRFCRHRVVLDSGEAFAIEPFQRAILSGYFEGVTEALVLLPKKNGKGQALDTPLPTPTGWTTMGDLEVGDELFDERGEPCRVTFTAPITHRSCYRVRFSDGTSVVADDVHLWETRQLNRGYQQGVVTTDEIRRTLRRGDGAANHSIDVAAPLQTPVAELPLDPYVLGAWLGDGATSQGCITNPDPDVWAQIEAAGFELGPPYPSQEITRTVRGLSPLLRQTGVFGHKHIPAVYLRASIAQRMELLRGLLDTDGFCSPVGQIVFYTTSPDLRDGMLELARSLGFKPTVREDRAILNGRDYGPAWDIQFWAYDDTPVFHIARKRARQKQRPSRRARSGSRQIVAVEPVESVPTRCIQVDSPSRLYLCGEGMVPTHNTTLLAALALYHLIYTPNAQCYIAASAVDQARILYEQACGFVERKGPGGKLLPQAAKLQKRVLLRKGTKEIRSRRDSGFVRVVSGDKDTVDGVIVTLGLVDELHRHKDGGQLYGVLADGVGPRDGQVITISTAGETMKSALGRMRQKALALPGVKRKGKYTFVRSPNGKFEMHEWSLDDEDDREDLELVKLANPLSNNTIEKLQGRKDSPTMTVSRWARFGCGVWMQGEDAAYSSVDWARNGRDGLTLEPGTEVYLGLDIGWRWDTTAVVPGHAHERVEFTVPNEKTGEPEEWWRFNRVRYGRPKILVPPRNGDSLPHEDVINAVLYFRDELNLVIVGVVFDRNAEGEKVAQELENVYGIPAIEHSQDPAAMADSSMGFGEALGHDLIEHPKDDEFTAHILACKAKTTTGEKWRIVAPEQNRGQRKKGKQEGDDIECVDAAQAAVMLHRVATASRPLPKPLNVDDYRIGVI